jgi:hypothetical protein
MAVRSRKSAMSASHSWWPIPSHCGLPGTAVRPPHGPACGKAYRSAPDLETSRRSLDKPAGCQLPMRMARRQPSGKSLNCRGCGGVAELVRAADRVSGVRVPPPLPIKIHQASTILREIESARNSEAVGNHSEFARLRVGGRQQCPLTAPHAAASLWPQKDAIDCVNSSVAE